MRQKGHDEDSEAKACYTVEETCACTERYKEENYEKRHDDRGNQIITVQSYIKKVTPF